MTHTVTSIAIKEDKEAVIVTEDDEVVLAVDKIGNLFGDTSSEEKLSNEWLQANIHVLQDESSSLQEPANVMYIQICDQAIAKFPVKISGINFVAFCDTGVNMFVCHVHVTWS